MKILIVAATQAELAKSTESFELISEQSTKLNSYRYNNLEIDILVTGVGILFTAYYVTKAIASKKYDLAINVGLAGTFSNELPIGTVVNVTHDYLSELGAENGEEWISIADLGFISSTDFPYTHQGIINNLKYSNVVLEKLKNVKGITVNTVHGNKNSVEKIKKLINAEVETMEGASFLYCCMASNISCVQIRAISNLVEKRNKENWNIPLALKNLNVALISLIKAIAE